MGIFDFIKAIGQNLESTSSAAYKLFIDKLPGKSEDKELEDRNVCMKQLNHDHDIFPATYDEDGIFINQAEED